MSSSATYEKYLRLAEGAVGLRGKRVLEVGGSTPPEIVTSFNPRAWNCVNLNERDVATFNATAKELGMDSYAAHYQDVAQFRDGGGYDLVYSINSFEHISNLEEGFERMYEALRPGGILFTIFGPIWSADVGHHLSIQSEHGDLHFSNGVLEPWEHLTSTPVQLQEKLADRYTKETARRAVDFIYDYPDLNRLCDHEYVEIVRNSRFSPVLVLRKRHGKPPDMPGATSTREFLMVLKKGRTHWWNRVACLSRFALAYLRNR